MACTTAAQAILRYRSRIWFQPGPMTINNTGVFEIDSVGPVGTLSLVTLQLLAELWAWPTFTRSNAEIGSQHSHAAKLQKLKR